MPTIPIFPKRELPALLHFIFVHVETCGCVQRLQEGRHTDLDKSLCNLISGKRFRRSVEENIKRSTSAAQAGSSDGLPPLDRGESCKTLELCLEKR